MIIQEEIAKRFFVAKDDGEWAVLVHPYSCNEDPITILVYETKNEALAVRDKFNQLMDEV